MAHRPATAVTGRRELTGAPYKDNMIDAVPNIAEVFYGEVESA
ncbi:hypothetical protein [Nocardioides sp. URHA0020]|nr:hypothetical protein [Nocardioides sp. URHA0020]